MRSGKLLAEEAPQVLLQRYGCQSLEEVFLKLSRKQGNANTTVELTTNNITTPDSVVSKTTTVNVTPMNWGKKDDSIFVTEESGIVGINFHQSKEVLIQDNTNGHVDVIMFIEKIFHIN